MFLATATLLGLVLRGAACAGDHLHARHGDTHARDYMERRERPQVPLTPPYRPLVWGDLNVIHTTDTHGWLLGHQKTSLAEPNYSGDLGDFASFVTHMKQIAIEKDVDLLLVDSGDLHDGTGLSDGYPPGGVDAHDSNEFLKHLPYDLMTIGNHELYDYAITHDMYTNFVPHLAGRYLSSNVNITVFNSDGTNESVPVGSRSVKFTTSKGRRITSLGVLFNFFGNAGNTTVQRVADMVKEQWFAEAIAEEPDAFVLIGHMPVSNDSWTTVFDAIRPVHPWTPILIFGGHTHIRDCQQYDGRSMAIESGRYMETIGWMSADIDAAKGNTNDITFTRRYLDQNRVTYEYHTQMSGQAFDTITGHWITRGLHHLAARFDLSYLYGTAPQDYTLYQDPYPSNGSLLSLFVEDAVPYALSINNTRNSIPNIIIINSGALRFDVLKGPFTKNDQLTASEYKDLFFYIPNVPFSIANQVLPALNNVKQQKRDEIVMEPWRHGAIDGQYRAWLKEMDRHWRTGGEIAEGNLTLGYVTNDSCPGAGDDTLHKAVSNYWSPDYIGSKAPNVTDDTPVDVIFDQYLESNILAILNRLQNETKYTGANVSNYSSTLTNAVLGLYAQSMWN